MLQTWQDQRWFDRSRYSRAQEWWVTHYLFFVHQIHADRINLMNLKPWPWLFFQKLLLKWVFLRFLKEKRYNHNNVTAGSRIFPKGRINDQKSMKKRTASIRISLGEVRPALGNGGFLMLYLRFVILASVATTKTGHYCLFRRRGSFHGRSWTQLVGMEGSCRSGSATHGS